MENTNRCPFKETHETTELYQSNRFYQKIKTYFSLVSIVLLIIAPIGAFYFNATRVLYAWPFILILLLMLYPLIIRNQFVAQNAVKKLPYCGILTNIYDVVFRPSVLLREIDLERKQKYGDMYLSFFGFKPVVIVTSSVLAEHISKDLICFEKSDPRDLCMPYFYQWVGNNNIVLANGDLWKETRSLIHPILNEVQLFLPLMYEKSNVLCSKIENIVLNTTSSNDDGVPIKLTRWLKALSLDISGEALFGYQFNHLNEETNPGIEATDYILHEIFSPARLALPILNRLPIKSNVQLNKSIKLLDELVFNMIDYYTNRKSKDSADSTHQNVLAILLQAKHNQSVSMHELRNNILALVLASHETTQVALGGVLYYLAKYPQWQQRIREESINLFPDLGELFSKQESVLDKKNSQYWKLKTFENLEHFILESMRHYSPLANQNPRTTTDRVELGGYEVPKGTLVIMNLHAIHMSETEWENAQTFDPDRYKKGNRFNKFAYLPFGNGPRLCSGREFSLIEQKLAVCLLLRNFEISLPNKAYEVPIMRYSFTGIPDDSFELCFKQRT